MVMVGYRKPTLQASSGAKTQILHQVERHGDVLKGKWSCVKLDEALDASQKRVDPHHTSLYAVDPPDSLARLTTPRKANPHCPTLAASHNDQCCVFDTAQPCQRAIKGSQ